MPDISQQWGDDLQVSATGDLAVVDGTTLGEQRVLRRLLTNPGDYIWHPTYGAGLPARVGANLDIPALTAVIRSQMFQEAVVSKNPLPVVVVKQVPGNPGAVSVDIRYTDAQTGQQASLSFDLGA